MFCFSSLTLFSLRYDDGTKDESALPFHVHLSLALKQLIGPSVDEDCWDEEDSDYLGPTPKWFYSFYDDGVWFPSAYGPLQHQPDRTFPSRTLP